MGLGNVKLYRLLLLLLWPFVSSDDAVVVVVVVVVSNVKVDVTESRCSIVEGRWRKANPFCVNISATLCATEQWIVLHTKKSRTYENDDTII